MATIYEVAKRAGVSTATVPDIANPFFSLILKGIEDAARREGYNVLVGDTQHEEEREGRCDPFDADRTAFLEGTR